MENSLAPNSQYASNDGWGDYPELYDVKFTLGIDYRIEIIEYTHPDGSTRARAIKLPL